MRRFLSLLRRTPLLFLSLALAAVTGRTATFHVAPDGSDTGAGTESAPFATIMRAQAAASAGDTVLLRGGTYFLDDTHIARSDSLYAYVNDFTKSGISYLAYPGETPVFDFSAVKPSARRITAFFIRANDLHFRGFHVVGVQVTIRAGEASNTQSESFRISGGSRNRLEQLTLRDGMGIGVYIIGSSANNLVLNCDAYNNVGLDSLSIGNVDGFGSHTNANGTGNVFRGCRAWLNSDDGFDLINCHAPVLIENCWAAFSGYKDAALAVGADGNGFKAGGYGRNGSALPALIPRHVVRFSLAVRNRASGFYANHHPGGLDFIHNTAFRNATNYNLLNVLADNLTNVPGYDHFLRNNLGFSPRSVSVSNFDPAACDTSHNFFELPVTVTAEDFVSAPTDTAALLAAISAPRADDGSIPAIDLLRLSDDSDLIDRGAVLNLPYNRTAPDLGCFENTFVPDALDPVARWTGEFLPGQTDPAVVGAEADPDQDGRPNLLEYFCGTDPTQADVAPALTLRAAAPGEWELAFSKAKDPLGASYRIESSPDLVAWADSGIEPTVAEDLGALQRMRAPVPAAAGDRHFWRLRVTQTGG